VAHSRTFGSGNASFGTEAEATALFSSSAYLTEISNNLTWAGRDLESIEALILSSPSEAAERLLEVRWGISNVHVAAFGT
jgi:hypothetical protein